MRESTVTVERRFRGPPSSGNGGYCAGLLAEELVGAVEVTLHSPPPLERALQLTVGEQQAALFAGEVRVANARVTPLDLAVPAAPTIDEAEACTSRFAGIEAHLFPECFVCGPARAPGDGLRIFPGRADGLPLVAAAFIPDATLTDGVSDVPVRAAVAWAALDCPGYFAAAHGERALLGRMTAELTRLPLAGERCVVIGWPLGREGRKIYAGTALFDATGVLLGRARQTWITLR
jgi:hypothetical protein